ncbi:MAG: RagB/SusD family nutrient uptake outer membrane protein [Gemmatimonas sp.]|nr:RagB/SusD family nutrient uptake outer membrane protein [Gemmatimonas sp.]
MVGIEVPEALKKSKPPVEMTMNTRSMNTASLRLKRHHRRGIAVLGLLVLSVLPACDFEVTNPGPVADEFLDNPAANEAVVNGIAHELNAAVNWIALDVAVRTRELHPTSANDFLGITISAHEGTFNLDHLNDPWELGHRARWIGEDAIRRFQEAIPADVYGSTAAVARANLWTGYANRLLGGYFCETVIDGGSPQPGSVHLELAEAQFTEAIEVAEAAGVSDVATAARAARASVRVDLGDWSGARADAAAVPTDFSFLLPFYDTSGSDFYNAFYYIGTAGEPYNTLSVWNTFYEGYYDETGDPRTLWDTVPDEPYGSGGLDPWGAVPWWPQGKHSSAGSPIEMSSGEEMRLIEAEAMLLDGDIDGAMAMINSLRVRAGVDAWPAPATLAEAWQRLKTERGIELWLEGRRLADQRRWEENDAPGELSPYELGLTNDGPGLLDAVLCLPIATSERETNPNVS